MAFVYPLFIANQKIELILVFFLCYEVTDLSAEPKPKPSNQGRGVYYKSRSYQEEKSNTFSSMGYTCQQIPDHTKRLNCSQLITSVDI